MDNSNTLSPLAYSPTDASKLLGLGRTKVFELLKNGTLKSFKYGSRRLIKLDAIQKCLELLEKEGQ